MRQIKLIRMLIIIGAMLSVWGCGGGDDGDKSGGAGGNAPSGVNILFLNDLGWEEVMAHNWGVAEYEDTVWPGNALADVDDGWFEANFPDATAVNFVINNNPTENSERKTVNLSCAATCWCIASEVLFEGSNDPNKVCRTEDPALTPLLLSALPNNASISGQSLAVTLRVQTLDSYTARYSLDGSDPSANGTSFISGDQVIIGNGIDVGQSVTLRIHATDGTNEVSETLVYRKVAPPGDNNEAFNDLRIYQVMVESFQDGDSSRNYNAGWGPSDHKGDIQGIIDALPYIASLNVNAIWLTPIFDSGSGSGDEKLNATGYFAEDYFKIDPKFGVLGDGSGNQKSDIRKLVNDAHDLGLYVFFDGVFGHHKSTGVVARNGETPASNGQSVIYGSASPDPSEAFFTEVTTYWINELGIDGWRLDQAYQVPLQNWQNIRTAAESTCAARKDAGEQWGTLCYMVAEIWDSEQTIAQTGYGPADGSLPGLISAFDFPMRYRIVQTLAQEENAAAPDGRLGSAANLNGGFGSHRFYPEYAVPNLMIGNHDLLRFGDLIQRAGLAEPSDEEYWQRHEAAFSFLAAYTGPVTMYYNEELGAEIEGFAQPAANCGAIDRCDDHVARNNGTTSADGRAAELKSYVAELMLLREQNPVLSQGDRINLVSSGATYVDLKQYNGISAVFALNVDRTAITATISQSDVGGTKLVNMKDANDVISASNGVYAIPLMGFEGAFYTAQP